MRLDEVYQAALAAGSGGIRFNEVTNIIQLKDTQGDWINWKWFNPNIGVDSAMHSVTITGKYTSGNTTYFENSTAPIIHITASTRSANNHLGEPIELFLADKTTDQTINPTHNNQTIGQTEGIRITIRYTASGFMSFDWIISPYTSYVGSYGLNATITYITLL